MKKDSCTEIENLERGRNYYCYQPHLTDSNIDWLTVLPRPLPVRSEGGYLS